MELLIALIPALPLAGFVFAVLVGPRIDRVPSHGEHEPHGEAHDGHDAHDAGSDTHGDAHDEAHGAYDAGLEPIPGEEEQAATSPHAGHADDLANAAGADGVIPLELNDGLGQAGHVTPDGPRPLYRS